MAQGKEDITIKVSDEGGGIPRSAMPLIWTYMYSTAKTPSISLTEEQEQQLDYKPPLAGYGYGYHCVDCMQGILGETCG